MSFVSSHLERLAFKTFDTGDNETVYSYGSRQQTEFLARRSGHCNTMQGRREVSETLGILRAKTRI